MVFNICSTNWSSYVSLILYTFISCFLLILWFILILNTFLAVPQMCVLARMYVDLQSVSGVLLSAVAHDNTLRTFGINPLLCFLHDICFNHHFGDTFLQWLSILPNSNSVLLLPPTFSTWQRNELLGHLLRQDRSNGWHSGAVHPKFFFAQKNLF